VTQIRVEDRKAVRPFFRVPIDELMVEAPDQHEKVRTPSARGAVVGDGGPVHPSPNLNNSWIVTGSLGLFGRMPLSAAIFPLDKLGLWGVLTRRENAVGNSSVRILTSDVWGGDPPPSQSREGVINRAKGSEKLKPHPNLWAAREAACS
jgi:hypothetical protein